MKQRFRRRNRKLYYIIYTYGGEWHLLNNRRGPLTDEEAEKAEMECHANGARTKRIREM